MDFSVPLNISTNAWNIIKFMAMYVLLDVTIPILLESIDKASIIQCFSRNGRVPIANYTKDRQVRSGVRELVADMRRRFRKRPILRRPQRAVKLRLLLLFSVWVASIIGEYGSGSEPRIIQVEVSQSFAGTEGFLQAMFSCVQAEHTENDDKFRLSVRNATMTNEGMKCYCSYPEEVGCTMPVQVEHINATARVWELEFLSNETVHMERYYAVDTSTVYVLVQGRDSCTVCSDPHEPVEDVPFNVYGALDDTGKLSVPAMYAAKLRTGTLVGLAYGKEKAPTEQDTLGDLFWPSRKATFLQGVWERPEWKNRSFVTTDMAKMISGTRDTQHEFLEFDRPPDFSAIWCAWWLRGHINNTLNGTVTLNTSSTETATISPLGIFSFSYVTMFFLLLLVYSIASRKWRRLLKTSGYGNVEWLISALIAQQQLRGSSLRGVDDLEQFDLTVVKHDSGVPHVSAQHWIASLTLASPTKNIDVIDGMKDPDEEGNDEV